MRWHWIDRFIEFESGRRAVAIKNVSMVEEQLDGYMPGWPVMPNTLICEGMAQTAGLLVGEFNQFNERVVLAKLTKAVYHCYAVPGDQLRYTAVIDRLDGQGAIANVTSHVGETLQAEAEICFAHLDERFPGRDLFSPAELAGMLRQLGLYDIGRTSTGAPLEMPARLAEAEREAAKGL